MTSLKKACCVQPGSISFVFVISHTAVYLSKIGDCYSILCAITTNATIYRGYPGATDGVGAFAYQDSTGNSIRVRRFLEPLPPLPPLPPLAPLRMRPFRRFKPLDFGAFGSDTRNLDLALSAAHQAYDLASNRIPYMPNFDFRFPPFGGFPNFVDQGIPMPYGMSDNSAYAGAAAGPGYSQHRAFINPQNPQNPNVDVTKTYSDPGRNGGYYSVSSTSYASSSNVDGQVKSHRGAETKVNNNGEVTHYKVQS
ncbi:uncharacterized protein [Epargyreus clarus]|uniref:uncharacterized protein isoform X5 n=1 Tax=Epargyreus clarus TaxID=520877 RepID=UPI003C2C9425